MSKMARAVFKMRGLCVIHMWALLICCCLQIASSNDLTPASDNRSSVEDRPLLNQFDIPKLVDFETLLRQYQSLLVKGHPVDRSHAMGKDLQEQLLVPLLAALQNFQGMAQHDLEVTPKVQKKMRPRVNILTDPTYAEPMVLVNLALGLTFFVFIILAFIYDAMRISKEARRRSNAVAAAKQKKNEDVGKKQSLTSKYRESITALFSSGLKKSLPQPSAVSETESNKPNESSFIKAKSESNVTEAGPAGAFGAQGPGRSVGNLRDGTPLRSIPEIPASTLLTVEMSPFASDSEVVTESETYAAQCSSGKEESETAEQTKDEPPVEVTSEVCVNFLSY